MKVWYRRDKKRKRTVLFSHPASISSSADRAAQNLRRDSGGHRASLFFEILLRPRRLLRDLMFGGVDSRGGFGLYLGDQSLSLERRLPSPGPQTFTLIQNPIDRLEERVIEYVDQQEDGKEYE